jgi:toxin HigB-1
MITSFADKETAKVFAGEFSKKLPLDIQASAQEKMIVLDKCEDIKVLWKLPGLNVEKLNVRGCGQLLEPSHQSPVALGVLLERRTS